MLDRWNRLLIVFVAVCVALVVVFGSVAGFNTLNVRNPATDSNLGSENAAIVPPPFLNPEGGAYVEHQSGMPITAPDGRPVAQLDEAPAHLSEPPPSRLP